MQNILISLAIVVVGASCATDKSADLQRAEAERRAEVLEAQHEEEKLEAEHRQERAALKAEQSKDHAAVDAEASHEIARASEEVAEKSIEIGADQAAFQSKAVAHLESLNAKIVGLKEKAKASKKTPGVIEQVLTGATALKADVKALKEKLPAVVQVTSDATWTVTKKDLEKQVSDLDDRYQALDDLI